MLPAWLRRWITCTSLRYSLGLAVNGMWACELGFSLAGLLVGVHLMGADCVMGNGLGAVRVSGDRMLVRHLSRRADRGRACLRRRLADLPELAAGGALAYCTGTTPDTGWAAGPAAAPPAYCAG